MSAPLEKERNNRSATNRGLNCHSREKTPESMDKFSLRREIKINHCTSSIILSAKMTKNVDSYKSPLLLINVQSSNDKTCDDGAPK